MARHYRRKNAARIKRILTATSVMSWAAFEMRWNTRRNQFRLSAKQTSLFKLAGASVQSTTGSRGVRISGSNGINAGYTMFRGSVKGTGYPLHSPVSLSLPLPCATVCHHHRSSGHHVSTDAKGALAPRRFAGAVTVRYTSSKGIRFLLAHQREATVSH